MIPLRPIVLAVALGAVYAVMSCKPALGASCSGLKRGLCEIYVSGARTKTRRRKRPTRRARTVIKIAPPAPASPSAPAVPMPRPAPPRSPSARERIADVFAEAYGSPLRRRTPALELPAHGSIEFTPERRPLGSFAIIIGGSAACAIAAAVFLRRRIGVDSHG